MPNIWLARARHRVLWALVVFLSSGTCLPVHADTATILVTRAYHVDDRTRVVLETSRPINYQMLLLKNPDRLVLDMQDVKLDETLRAMAGKIRSDDPYIRQVRMAYFKPRVVRLVFDLKGEVKPSLFTLVPMGEYRDRLVLDIYPLNGLSATMPDKPIERSATQLQKPDIATPQPKPDLTTESRLESMPSDNTLPAAPAKTPVATVLKTPVTNMETVADSADSTVQTGSVQRNDKASSLPAAGLAITTLIAGCLLLLLL